MTQKTQLHLAPKSVITDGDLDLFVSAVFAKVALDIPLTSEACSILNAMSEDASLKQRFETRLQSSLETGAIESSDASQIRDFVLHDPNC
jgi:hypothetical protein